LEGCARNGDRHAAISLSVGFAKAVRTTISTRSFDARRSQATRGRSIRRRLGDDRRGDIFVAEAVAALAVLDRLSLVMLPMFLAVADQTIVAAALPAIASDLGDVERISWVVVSYLVANTIAAPVYGRLGDSFGRRAMILAGLALFMVGSVLCALAPNVRLLTAARVLRIGMFVMPPALVLSVIAMCFC
jgi:Na+/melibiose symporter-like transporter